MKPTFGKATVRPIAPAAIVLAVCVGYPFAVTSQSRALQSSISPQRTCASLAGMTLARSSIKIPSGATTITSAELVAPMPAGRADAQGGPIFQTAGPEYCKVLGTIAPVDPSAPPINFQINLPTAWNQKAVQLGGGGLGGGIPGSLNTHRNAPEAQPVDVGSPLTKGFIELGNDLGHQNAGRGAPPGSGNAWMLNGEAVRNWARDAPKKNLDAAIELARIYYGQPPRRNYYMGSSGGGREALFAVQAYPDDYEGIFAQVPAIAQLSITLRATVFAQQQTTMERWLPPSKVRVIANEVLRQCDGMDGLTDGVISAYRRCDAIFINHPATAHPWAQIRCPSGRDEGEACLSDAQIATLDFIHTDVDYGYALANGVRTIAAFAVGGERDNWITERMPAAAPYTGGLFPPLWKTLIVGDPDFPQLMWDPAKYKDRWIAASKEYEAENPDLLRFISHGGKLIIKSNTADTAVNWREAAAYYERVVAKVGRQRADASVRYYVAPGQVHSMANNPVQRSLTGEEIPSQFDSVELLDAWVEARATAGDAVMLYQKNPLPPFAVTSSRPMCQYPLFPKFVVGDKLDGRSYRCVAE